MAAAAVAAVLALLRVVPAVRRDRSFRRLVVAAAAAGAAAAVVLAWSSLGERFALLLLLLTTVAVAIAALGIAAVVLEVRAKPGDPAAVRPGGAGRIAWTLALATSLLFLSLPVERLLFRWEKRRAMRWVEAMAAEVRAERASTGTYPRDLEHLVEKVGGPPRFVANSDGLGYYAYPGGFAFAVEDPSSFFFTTSWHYDGETGAWAEGDDDR